MNVKKFIIKVIRKIYIFFSSKSKVFEEDLRYVEFSNQEANDLVCSFMQDGMPFLVAKFGTIELEALLQYQSSKQTKYGLHLLKDIITNRYPLCTNDDISMEGLYNNAGFFPKEPELLGAFYKEYTKSINAIDVLGSYVYGEKYLSIYMPNVVRINIDGYLYPFFYSQPWTKLLKGKRVLVVHPYQQEIEDQYKIKDKVWGERVDEILPEFQLITYKPVQSILGTTTIYSDWFEALDKMKNDIAKIEFDIAIVGCGAYGLPLASFCKYMGRQAIHLAGSTQILFGIIGKRWEEDPKYKPYINKYWIRPYKENIPENAKNIEGGCYW